ncbi:Mov34/MPN/PAD-1 family protein [Novimethylophilus kurashikiensis]|uniref:Mov34/MPN/PAD-1 family protein n=1 Tax=Novimethylophilus kurashikiensis TaxID=1825523 RepID=UPI000D596865|nr:Mov34/MPN/PAD-1 family protein [Novimethylophilus kurashikiensis]
MPVWGTADHRHFVLIPDQILAIFDTYRQVDFEAKESGGILLGKCRGDHIELCYVTAPAMHDKRARTLFTRQPQIHQEIADRLWCESAGQITYLGEWHTHPEAVPEPSTIDVANSKDILKRHPSGAVLLFIIVGTSALHVQLSSSDSSHVLQSLEP